ncbi:MAG: carboxypeptidase-like regulatory domain-containing protein [Candidatus Bathyarchaeota archaeon]|nr:carboxypeptidase-like regulatory domain-containing protein [Candidatus Bathyarchaeota archaeon]
MKKKAAKFILLILLSVSLLAIPFLKVLGQLGVNIYLVNPEKDGVVGQTVNLQGTIDTANGEYQIWFDNELVANHTSEGYHVNANFTIPQLPGGDYTIIMRDVSKNVNASHAFSIRRAYYIEAVMPSSPKQLQQGSAVVLNVRLTGLQSDTSYYANVTVELPEPLSNISYSKLVGPNVSNQEAVITAQVVYPSASFQPEGSLTDYTGSYQVYLNKTQMLAKDQFFVGFTDSKEYHRGEDVEIRAIGYQPDENATISIKYSKNNAILYSETVTATSEGIVISSWKVPSDAFIGDYNITITPENTIRLIPDSQLFTVPGYNVRIRTFNLASELVPQIRVEAVDQVTKTLHNFTSASDGIANLSLEEGDYIISAFWNGVKVGEMNVSITGESMFDLTCALTNLKITIQNDAGNQIPFVNLYITYQYNTTKDRLLKTGYASGKTDFSGSFVLRSIFPEISCTINASLYGIIINVGNNTVNSLLLRPVSEVIVLCPSRTLTLKLIDSNQAAIPNARIELLELTSGLFHGATTDASGTVIVEVTFGKYRLRVYKDDVVLNVVTIEVFTDTQKEVFCSLYNIQLSVKVVDYFNQPIPNMNVLLNRQGTQTQLTTTQFDGTATFGNVIGGNIQIITYPEGLENSYEAVELRIEEPTEVRIRLSKYILIGPFLIDSSMLATLILILLAIFLSVFIEVYRRKRAKTVSKS